MFSLLTETETPVAGSAFDFSSLDLTAMVPTFLGAVAAAIGITITVLAIKKGISWLISSIKRA